MFEKKEEGRREGEEEGGKRKRSAKKGTQGQIERLKEVSRELKRRTEASCVVSGPLSVVLTDSPEETDPRVPRVAEVRDAGANSQSLDKDPAIFRCFQRRTLPSCEQQQFPQPLTLSKPQAYIYIYKPRASLYNN